LACQVSTSSFLTQMFTANLCCDYQFIIRLMVILFLKVHNLCVTICVWIVRSLPKAGRLPNSECQPHHTQNPSQLNPIKWSLEDNSKPIGTKSSTEKWLKMIIFARLSYLGFHFSCSIRCLKSAYHSTLAALTYVCQTIN
jgi:hypothetical protein